jgi:thiosulfate/3-mercaptopyruvate sulfurtransferase
MSAEFGPLVSGGWLAEHRNEVRIVDVRWYLDGRSGLAAYLSGHIPGAVWLDIDTELAAPSTREDGRHPLPPAEQFADVMAKAAIGQGQRVVAYDDAGGSVAARLWWMLRVLGEPVAVLDGGMQAWPGELSTQVPSYPPAKRPPQPWPASLFVTADEVAAGVAADTATVLDARTAQRFEQGDPAIDPRPGHIPGARSMPWAGNLDESTGRFRAAAELRERYRGVRGRAIAYCGSGVTSCHDLLALELAGVSDTALYAGSWSQWGADAARPAETGPDRGHRGFTDA